MRGRRGAPAYAARPGVRRDSHPLPQSQLPRPSCGGASTPQHPLHIRGLSVLSTTILRDLVAYLNLVHSPHHNVSLTRVLLAPRWRFPEELALEIRKQGAKDRCSLFDVLDARDRMLASNGVAETGWREL